MSRKRKYQVAGAGAISIVVLGVTAIAVALDRWDSYTQYDQTIYYGATVVVYLVAKALMKAVNQTARHL